MHTQLEMDGSGDVCRQVLATLPTWFGIPASVEDYAATAEANPTVVASVEGRDAGLLTLVVHNEYSAEVHVMGVEAGLHRRGIGQAMLQYGRVLAGRARRRIPPGEDPQRPP